MTNNPLRDAFIAIMNEKMRHMETLQDLQSSGLTYTFDDGRTVEDMIAEEDNAICNLQSAIDRLMG